MDVMRRKRDEKEAKIVFWSEMCSSSLLDEPTSSKSQNLLALGAAVSHLLRMQKALGSILSVFVSMDLGGIGILEASIAVKRVLCTIR